jgi:hypothetical protein
MTTTTRYSPPVLAREDDDVEGDDDVRIDAPPGWSVRCGKFGIIGLALISLVGFGVIVALAVMLVGSEHRGDPVPVVVLNGTSDTAITISAAGTDTMETATVGTVPMSASTGTGSTSGTAVTTGAVAASSYPTPPPPHA